MKRLHLKLNYYFHILVSFAVSYSVNNLRVFQTGFRTYVRSWLLEWFIWLISIIEIWFFFVEVFPLVKCNFVCSPTTTEELVFIRKFFWTFSFLNETDLWNKLYTIKCILFNQQKQKRKEKLALSQRTWKNPRNEFKI